MAIAPPTFVPDELVTAAKMNLLPKGVLGRVVVTAGQSVGSTNADLTGMSIAVTVVANRLLRVTGFVHGSHSIAAGGITLRIFEGGTQLGYGNRSLPYASVIEFLYADCLLAPTAGAHTYKLNLLNVSGSGVASLAASATIPAFFLVEDLGAV